MVNGNRIMQTKDTDRGAGFDFKIFVFDALAVLVSCYSYIFSRWDVLGDCLLDSRTWCVIQLVCWITLLLCFCSSIIPKFSIILGYAFFFCFYLSVLGLLLNSGYGIYGYFLIGDRLNSVCGIGLADQIGGNSIITAMIMIYISLLATWRFSVFNARFFRKVPNIAALRLYSDASDEDFTESSTDGSKIMSLIQGVSINIKGTKKFSIIRDTWILNEMELHAFVSICKMKSSEKMKRLESTDLCFICDRKLLSKFVVDEFLYCNHIFHQSCLSKWLKNKVTCPQCKNGARSALYRFFRMINK